MYLRTAMNSHEYIEPSFFYICGGNFLFEQIST